MIEAGCVGAPHSVARNPDGEGPLKLEHQLAEIRESRSPGKEEGRGSKPREGGVDSRIENVSSEQSDLSATMRFSDGAATTRGESMVSPRLLLVAKLPHRHSAFTDHEFLAMVRNRQYATNGSV